MPVLQESTQIPQTAVRSVRPVATAASPEEEIWMRDALFAEKEPTAMPESDKPPRRYARIALREDTATPAPARRRYPYAQLAKLVSTATQVQVKYLKRCANTVKRQHIATRRGPPNVCHAKPEKVPQLDHRVVSTSARWERLPKTTTTIIIPQTAPTAQQAGSAISLAECCTRPIAQSALRGSSARER